MRKFAIIKNHEFDDDAMSSALFIISHLNNSMRDTVVIGSSQ